MEHVIKDRVVGSFIGLAIGDALGASVEFSQRGTFVPVTGMRDGGPWDLLAGQWTDDTIMALCMAESLIEAGSWDSDLTMKKWLAWYRDGHNSPKGYCFDIGNTTARSLAFYAMTGSAVDGWNDRAAGNGSIMRLVPAVMALRTRPSEAKHVAVEQGILTHNSHDAADCCHILAECILRGYGSMDVFSPIGLEGGSRPIMEIASGTYKDKAVDEIRSGGHCIETLEAALWACHGANGFADAVLRAVNLGDDTDSVGAVAGQIAGAIYGLSGIPTEWVNQLHRRDDLLDAADKLYLLGNK